MLKYLIAGRVAAFGLVLFIVGNELSEPGVAPGARNPRRCTRRRRALVRKTVLVTDDGGLARAARAQNCEVWYLPDDPPCEGAPITDVPPPPSKGGDHI
jgi:hypothetical protein